MIKRYGWLHFVLVLAKDDPIKAVELLKLPASYLFYIGYYQLDKAELSNLKSL